MKQKRRHSDLRRGRQRNYFALKAQKLGMISRSERRITQTSTTKLTRARKHTAGSASKSGWSIHPCSKLDERNCRPFSLWRLLEQRFLAVGGNQTPRRFLPSPDGKPISKRAPLMPRILRC